MKKRFFPSFTGKWPAMAVTVWAVWFVMLLSGCQSQPEIRVYTEINPSSEGNRPAGNMAPINTSPVDIEVNWKTPQGWIKNDSSAPMRIGSFAIPARSSISKVQGNKKSPSDSEPLSASQRKNLKLLDASIVKLAGSAGGLEANVGRWMTQVGLTLPPAKLAEFLAESERFHTKTGQEGVYVDLTPLLSGDITQSSSIFGAIVSNPDFTVFVKVMGDRGELIQERPRIKELCLSLEIRKSDS